MEDDGEEQPMMLTAAGAALTMFGRVGKIRGGQATGHRLGERFAAQCRAGLFRLQEQQQR
jgi:hypothetical protein